ncbi:MAG: preprotein translocase subunit SecE [Anaerolineaceae bacterium]|nr:preprotein translocase subunit SecE [Anaerolineaceae bacterium]
MTTGNRTETRKRRGWWPFGKDVDKEPAMSRERGVTTRKGRVTPGRRNQPVVQESGNRLTRPFTRLGNYFEGVRDEVNKVSWPSRLEARRLSVIVLVSTLLAAIVLGLITLGYSELFAIGLGQPLFFLGFFVVVVGLGTFFYIRSNRKNSASW